MKKLKSVVIALLAIVFLAGLIPITEIKADSGSSDKCCRNGFKTWQNTGFLGTPIHFKDCWCVDHQGKSMESCSCEVNGPNPN